MSAAPTASAGSPRSRPIAIELGCFAALAAFAIGHWFALIADPPLLRLVAVIAIAAAVAAALASLNRSPWLPAARALATGSLVLAGLAAALAATGVPLGLLLPTGWGELRLNLDHSLVGIAELEMPYAGGDAWVRLSIMLAAPLIAIAAAAVAFWPWDRGRGARRSLALALLVGLYVTAVTWKSPSAELARGVPLLLLIAAWLWLPTLAPRRLAPAGVALALAISLALPLALWARSSEAFVDYRSWRIFGAAGVGFDWQHSYGPLEWPQRGTLMFKARADRPHYWRVAVLDEFDGVRWRRSGEAPSELTLGPRRDRTLLSGEVDTRLSWLGRSLIEIRGFTSEAIVGPGTILEVDEVEASPVDGGTSWLARRAPESDETYRVLTYAPKPTSFEMDAAPLDYPAALAPYTALAVPKDDATVELRARFWGRGDPARLAGRFSGTPYERTFERARSLTAGAETPYEAATALESYLKRLPYEQDVPEHEYPLAAFLDEDREGYCQQFSGAMALMLRMIGIPARVASGFSPGLRDSDREDLFRIRDLDAHSWVEVYFTEIGWVTFDPTPAAAPAETEGGDSDLDIAGAVTARSAEDSDPGEAEEGTDEDESSADDQDEEVATGGGAGAGGGGMPPAILLVGPLALLGTGALAYAYRRRRAAGMLPASWAAAQLDELERAVRAIGWPLGARTTLLELERELHRRAGPAAARYAASLRELRYRPGGGRPPGRRERRALRRALLGAVAPWRAPRALAAVPPGGPRRPGRGNP